MLSGNPFILILGLISVIFFFYFLRIRASKKQINSYNQPHRMNYSWLWLRFGKNNKEPNIIEGKAEEVLDDKKD